MRIAVFGATGMLGRAVAEEAERRVHSVERVTRGTVDIRSPQWWSPRPGADVAINCAGVRPGVTSDAAMVASNGAGPHALAARCRQLGVPLMHVSTDCVFRGSFSQHTIERDIYGRHTPQARGDAIDLYGRSKLAGEPLEVPGVRVVRTSFIGPDHGLVRWIIDENRKGATAIPGYTNMRWSGSSVWEVARHLVNEAETPTCDPDGSAVIHLATAFPTVKFDVVRDVIAALDLGITAVVLTEEPKINRSLQATPGRELTPFAELLPEFAERTRAALEVAQ